MVKYLFLLLLPIISFSQAPETSAIDSLAVNRIDSLHDSVTKEFYKKNYAKTIELGESALTISENENYYDKYFLISSFLGNAYLEIDDTLRAKKTFTDAVNIAKKRKDTSGILVSQIDFGNFYALQETRSAKEEAIKIYKDILPLAKLSENKNRVHILNSNISEQYLDLNSPKRAEKYIIESETHLKDSIFIGFKGSTHLNRARYLTQTGNYIPAKERYNKALTIFKKLDYLDGIIDTYKYAVENAVALGDYQLAYKNQNELDTYELEKYEVDKLEAVQTLTTKFKLEEIEKELKDERLLSSIKEERAKEETRYFWIKVASGILLLSSIILLYFNIIRRKLLASLLKKNKQYLDEKERAQELSKAKSQLFSNITHELRTPMYGIIGISNMLLEDEKHSHQSPHIKSLRFSANYLLSLVNNILLFNQSEKDIKDATKNEVIDIQNIVYNTVASSKFLSEQNPNHYNVVIDDKIPNRLVGDKTKLSQILINIIGNASKFTNDGNIDIILDIEDKNENDIKISFTIRDDGPGIAEEDKKNLFDKLKLSSKNQDFMGTGLGLPIVKKLLEEQRSHLSIDSNLGEGTCVQFTLSFKIDKSISEERETNTIENISLKNNTILVIDDNKINQIVTKKFLERFDAKVTALGSGKEGIAFLKENKVDLILMDINMPEMNGFEATEAIRQFNKKVPIIALTAVEKSKVMGDHSFNLMNGIIIKPYSENVFIQTMMEHLTVANN